MHRHIGNTEDAISLTKDAIARQEGAIGKLVAERLAAEAELVRLYEQMAGLQSQLTEQRRYAERGVFDAQTTEG